ncbi:MAG: HD domain-containing protein [Candidatus Dojkabacteria bacterium]
MHKNEVVEKTAEHVKSLFTGEGSGHDWWHILRVWNNAKLIASKEKSVNLFHIELGALLHDIADYKFHGGDETIGGKTSAEWLKGLGVDENDIEAVVHIVDNVSYKGGEINKIKSFEGMIVQDADRLDAIGAIGIARCFAYGGNVGHEIYNPDIKPSLNMSKEEYKKHKSTQVNHFYEKLLKLKDLMNTKSAKRIAQKRHVYMEKYLQEFLAEWEGKR